MKSSVADTLGELVLTRCNGQKTCDKEMSKELMQ
jgi:hypothetical protein